MKMGCITSNVTLPLVDGVPPKEAKGAYVVNVTGLCTDGMFPSDTINVAAFA